MHPSEKVKTHRKPTNLSLDNELLREAKALGINVSRSAEAGIEVAVRRQKPKAAQLAEGKCCSCGKL
jgi:antitoxin CcdA